MSDVILGIDLGTTNTVAAVTQGEQTLVVADDTGRKIQPSVIAFHPNGNVLIGEKAKERRAIDPRNTIFSIKRLIGRGMLARETREMCERMPFEIGEGTNQQPIITTRAGTFSAPEISALLLRRMKEIAEKALGHEITKAVVTVPASFTEAQRTATTAAGTIAGLDIVRIINEPTAAAVAFGYRKNLQGKIAVYDFGGGTFDISILRVAGDRFEVLSSAGDPFLGGDDIDNLLVRRMAEEFLEEHQIDLLDDAMAVQRLQGIAERVKIELGSRTRSVIDVEEIAYGNGGKPLNYQTEVTRDELESYAGELVRQTFPVCDEAMGKAGLSVRDIDALVLVGGTTKMPMVREMAASYFGREPRADVNPDEAIAIGAALQGAAIAALGPAVGRTTARGIGAMGVVPEVLSADDDIDTEVRQRAAAPPGGFQAAVEINNLVGSAGPTESSTLARIKTVKRPAPAAAPSVPTPEPEEQVVDTQGSITFDADIEELPTTELAPAESQPKKAPSLPIIYDITPHALGLATVAGYCEHVIRPNTPVPTESVKVFATSHDDQTEVQLRICQGNARVMDENIALGVLVLDGLRPAPRGETKIEVVFRLDASGRLHVRAKDPASGKDAQATLEVIGSQTPSEVAAARDRLRQIPS